MHPINAVRTTTNMTQSSTSQTVHRRRRRSTAGAGAGRSAAVLECLGGGLMVVVQTSSLQLDGFFGHWRCEDCFQCARHRDGLFVRGRLHPTGSVDACQHAIASSVSCARWRYISAAAPFSDYDICYMGWHVLATRP